MSFQKHPFHLVDPSPWPIFSAFGAFSSAVGAVAWFHGYEDGGYALCLGQFILLYGMFVWFRDIIREATFQGHHTRPVQAGLKMGMILFIVSEIMFFASFFWAFFHSSLAPGIEVGAIWPPRGIQTLDPWHIPLLNTVILLSSGVTCTAAQYALLLGKKKKAILGLVLTLILGFTFTGFQVVEYLEAPFCINDSVYGSVFFMATGFHGFHILIGSIFLLVCLVRVMKNHFSSFHHLGFDCAAMYWHFVDVVWLFLFCFLYWWGGNPPIDSLSLDPNGHLSLYPDEYNWKIRPVADQIAEATPKTELQYNPPLDDQKRVYVGQIDRIPVDYPLHEPLPRK